MNTYIWSLTTYIFRGSHGLVSTQVQPIELDLGLGFSIQTEPKFKIWTYFIFGLTMD